MRGIFICVKGGNTGDELIRQGALSYLKDRGLDIVESSGDLELAALRGDDEYLKDKMSDYDEYLIFTGGGNIGIYRENEIVRNAIIKYSKKVKGVLVFPQSCLCVEKSLINDKVTVWARDKVSFGILRKDGVRAALVPDAAFYMADEFISNRDNVGDGVFYIRRGEGRCLERVDMISDICCQSGDLTYDYQLADVVRRISSYRCIMSDRLHGAIISIMMGKRTVMLPLAYHKMKAFYDTWFNGEPGIEYAYNRESVERYLVDDCRPIIDLKKMFVEQADKELERFIK